MSQEPGRQRARQRLSVAMGGEVDPFETEDPPSAPAPTADVEVWISTPRNGIQYHDIAAGYRKTVCGRYIGRGVGEVERGYIRALAEVVDRYGAKPCKTCGGSSVPPVVVPGRSRWTT